MLREFESALSHRERSVYLQERLQTGASQVAADFNRADASALGSHFARDAEWVDGRGNTLTGRGAIVEALASFFSDNPLVQLVIKDQTLRFVQPDVAVERGEFTLARSRNGLTEGDYTALHVYKERRWQIAYLDHHFRAGASRIRLM